VPSERTQTVQLPMHADLADLLETLKSTSSPLYEDVLRRVLRLSGDALAFGREKPALDALRDQLSGGGPVLFPDEPPSSP
jgi:hypothetical protein